MAKLFGQIPKPDRYAAAEIAKAAREIEKNPQEYPSETSEAPESFPPTGANIPDVRDTDEVIEEVTGNPLPSSKSTEDSIYENSAGGVIERGIEYLAFYKSFRYELKRPAEYRWGIFFIKSRCTALATEISQWTGEPFEVCLDGLAALLYHHELYHYRFDAHCLQIEATGGSAVYRPYRKLVSSRPIDEWHEESIANYYGLNALREQKGLLYPQSICDFLWDMVEHSPGAYASGIEKQQNSRKDGMVEQATSHLNNHGSRDWINLVKSIVQSGTSLSKNREPSLSYMLRLQACPVYWIDWARGGKSAVTPLTISVTEVAGDFIKRYLGGTLERQTDHSYYRIDNGEVIKIPNQHRADLKYTEFKNIIGKAGLTNPQFQKERIRTENWQKNVPRNPVLYSRFPPNGPRI